LASRISDVIYFNPSDREFPVGFDLFGNRDRSARHLVASDIVGVFLKIWVSFWGVGLENTMRHAVLSLLEYPDGGLLGVLRVLMEEEYRGKIIEKEKHPIVLMFWGNQCREYALSLTG